MFLFFTLALVFTALTLHQSVAMAAQAQDKVLLDGLAVLAGGKSWNESDSIPVLISDIDFEATLLMIRERGTGETVDTPPDQVRIRARRWAVMVRLLARQAGQFKETTHPRDVTALRKELIAKAGGPEAMQQLFKRFGVDETALTQWIENALLAARQIRYIIEQVDMPLNEPPAPNSTGQPNREDSYLKTQRRMILKERTEQTMKKWLASILAADGIRIIP